MRVLAIALGSFSFVLAAAFLALAMREGLSDASRLKARRISYGFVGLLAAVAVCAKFVLP